jgi:hypothetical protein
VPEAVGDGVERRDGLGDDIGADPVAREQGVTVCTTFAVETSRFDRSRLRAFM